MSVFVIRNQGFFYTDEYFAPVGEYKQILRATFATREEAELACAAYQRRWIRSHSLGDFFFDDEAAVAAVVGYLRAQWPDEYGDLSRNGLYEAGLPDEATDAEVDELLRRGNLVLARVFEVEAEEDDEARDDDEERDEDELGEDDLDDELYWGPTG